MPQGLGTIRDPHCLGDRTAKPYLLWSDSEFSDSELGDHNPYDDNNSLSYAYLVKIRSGFPAHGAEGAHD